jgi:predicted nucleotidyltransferase
MNYNFNPDLPEPLNRIHPLQVKDIKKFLDNTFPPSIDRIYVFGSSVNLTCHPKSDIDFYLIHVPMRDESLEGLNKEMYLLGKTLKAHCDFLYGTQDDYEYHRNIPGSVEYDVYNEGVCIYAKKENNAAGQGES